MKLTKLSLLALSCAAAMAFSSPAIAQDSDDSKPAASKKMDRGGKRDKSGMIEKLPEELKERAKAAFDKAKNDPEVVAAREKLAAAHKDVKKAWKDAIRKADAEVADALEKVAPKKGSKKDAEND